MNKKLDLKNKKTLMLVITSILLTMVISFCTTLFVVGNNLNSLKGEVSAIAKEDEICGVDSSKNFITVEGSIIENFGELGSATITFTSGNKSYSKEIEISSEYYTSFSYRLPKETYNMTITKEGFNTYETTINESDNLKIILFNQAYANIIESNQLFYNIYYDYYKDGTLHIRTDGSGLVFQPTFDEWAADPSKVTILGNIIERQLTKNGLTPNFSSSTSGGTDLTSLAHALWNLATAITIGNDGATNFVDAGIPSMRLELLKYQETLKSGECDGDKFESNECNGSEVGMAGLYDSKEEVIAAIDCMLNIPINTKVIIDDDVSYISLANLSYIVSEELNIPSNLIYFGESAIISSSIGVLNFNSNLEEIPNSMFTDSTIGTVNIREGVKKIGEESFNGATISNLNLPDSIEEIDKSAFEGATISGLQLPSSLQKINNSAFRDANLDSVNLPEGLTFIGDGAFINNNLSEIVLPSTLVTIEREAFKNNPLKSIIVKESFDSNNNVVNSKTRFNSNWSSIGFPAELKPVSD